MRAIIFGLAAERLSVAERRFFQAVAPAGFILFKRNCQAPAQLRALTDALRDCLGWAAPILIDQEGGRVQRLAPPVWAARPAPGTFRAMADVDPAAAARAAYLNAVVMAAELAALGVDVNCVPDLDLAFPQAAPAVVGDRSYGDDPARVSALGRAVAEGTLAGGALPVIKHLPGHGRGARRARRVAWVADGDAGGGGAGAFTTSRSGIQTSSSLVGIGTTNADDNDLQGVGSSSTPTTTIAVTVGADSVSGQATGVFYFDGVEKPAAYQIERGMTFIFDQSDNSNEVYGGANHPLMFSLGPGGDHNGNGHYMAGVTYKLDGVTKTMAQYVSGFNAATTRQVVWTISADAPALLYYWCHHHTGQGNSFAVSNGMAKGLYISNGMVIHDNTLNDNHYIGTAFNGLMAGPVTINGNLFIDGNYVVV